MKWADVLFEAHRIRLWTRKRKGGLQSNLVPMAEELAAILREQLIYVAWDHRRRIKATGQIIPFPEYVFVNPETGDRFKEHGKFMHRLCAVAGVKPFGFHAIRHLSASMQDRARLPLSVIQGMMRHKDAKTTSRYIHKMNGVEAQLSGVFTRKEKGQPRTNEIAPNQVASQVVSGG